MMSIFFEAESLYSEKAMRWRKVAESMRPSRKASMADFLAVAVIKGAVAAACRRMGNSGR